MELLEIQIGRQFFKRLNLPDLAQSVRNHGVAMASSSLFAYLIDHKSMLTLGLGIYGFTMVYLGSLKCFSVKGEKK